MMVISIKELVSISKVSERTARGRIRNCEKVNLKQSGKGRPQKGIIVDTLPEDLRIIAQDYLIKKNHKEAQCETLPAIVAPKQIEPAKNLPISSNQVLPHKVKKKDVQIKKENDEKALAMYRLLMAYRDRIRHLEHGYIGEATEEFLIAYNTGEWMSDIFNVVGRISAKTLYKKNKILSDGGDDYLSLIDNRCFSGSPKKLTTRHKECFLKCYLQKNRPKYIKAYRGARTILESEGVECIPSKETFVRWFKNQYAPYNKHVIVLAREGEKAYKDRVGPYITRDISKIKPGEVLVADGHKLNYWIKHPITGRNVRMILIVFFDWASRFPVGWQLMPTENTISVQAALWCAIMYIGRMPVCVYIDNGKAFKNKFFNGDVNFEKDMGFYARLGIGVQYAMAYNARAKVVERFFETMNEQFERDVPSYCGSGIDDKPAHLNRNEKFHQIEHYKKFKDWVPTMQEAAYMIDMYFNWYGDQPHDGLSEKKPLEILTPALGPGVDVEALNREMLWKISKKPSRCRINDLYGVDYEGDFLHGIDTKIDVFYNTSDMREIYCYTQDGIKLGTAKPVQAIHPLARMFDDKVGMEDLKREMKRHNKLKKQTVAALKSVGASAEDEDYVKSLPGWGQKVSVVSDDSKKVVPIKQTTGVVIPMKQVPKITDEERKRFERLAEAEALKMEEEERQRKDPYYNKPEYFLSELDRYEWCFEWSVREGALLKNEDMAFMSYFEKTELFQQNYKGRFDDLRMLYSEVSVAAQI